jgi:ABC-2 type transport system permease protein
VEESTRLERLRHELAEPPASERPAAEDPRSPATFGSTLGARTAMMPPAPLGVLSVGQTDLYPYYFKISTRSRDTFINNDEIENPLNLLAGRFDAAFVVIYLFPLLILSVSYNLLAGEREQGTLAMVMAQPVTLARLAVGKITALAVIIIGGTIVLSMASTAFASSASAGDSAVAVRLASWCVLVVAYGGFWFALAVAVNVRGRQSAANAVVLAGAWMLFVVIVPSVMSVLAQTLYPVPSRVELIQAMRDATRDATAQGSQLLARYFEDHPEMLPGGATQEDMAAFNATSYAVQDEVARRVQPILEHFDHQLAQQQTVVDRFRYLSPAVVAYEAINDVAGTSASRYRHFLRQVNRFHQEWQTYFISKAIAKTSMTVAAMDVMPAFVFEEESKSLVVLKAGWGLAGLVVPTGFLVVLAASWLRSVSIAG